MPCNISLGSYSRINYHNIRRGLQVSVKIVQLTLVKSTKGTHVYGDDSDNSIIPTVYVKKHGLPTKPPSKLTLSLEYDVNE